MTTDPQARAVEVLAAHRYRDVLGDYEIAPYYRHFGCSCGWEQNIAGMSGWRSWMDAHHAHVTAALSEAELLVGTRSTCHWDAEEGCLRATPDEAIAAWEDKGPTSLTVALMADALYAARAALAEIEQLADEWSQYGSQCADPDEIERLRALLPKVGE